MDNLPVPASRDANLPTRPCLTPLLLSLLQGSDRLLFPEGRVAYSVPCPRWNPPPLAEEHKAEVAAAIAAHEAYLAPADPDWLGLRNAALVAIWYVPVLAAELTMIQADWQVILGRFPGWAVQAACLDWMETHRERPTLADLEQACKELTGDAAVDLFNLRRLLAGEEGVDRG